MKVKAASSLFLVALFWAGFADAAPPDRCDQYAKEALTQLRYAREMKLPVSGPEWSDNYQVHYTWCLRQTENTLVQGRSLRQTQIEKAKKTVSLAVAGARRKTGIFAGAASSDRCDQYAKEALTQLRYAREMKLPASGPEWSDNYQAHYTWCLSQTENSLVQGSSLRQTQIEKARRAGKYRDSRLSGGSAMGSEGGMAGPPQAPGGITWPGSGSTPPPFGAGTGDIPEITNPTGMAHPGDKIVTPDTMGKYTPGGSYGNLYGGVNPARDPRQGGGRGFDGVFSGTTKEDIAKLIYIFDPEAASYNREADAVVVDEGKAVTTIYYFHHDSDGKIFVEKVEFVKVVAESGESIDGAGNKGGKNPLSEEDRRKIREAVLSKVYEEVKNGPAVHRDGGVVDPVRNQANGDGNAPGSGKSSGQGKAPIAAKAPNSQKPGSLLTGGGRIDTDKPSAQVKLPQGFQVVDPPAQQGRAPGRVK